MKKLTVFLTVLAVLLTNCNKDESTPADKLTLEQFLSNNQKASKFFTVSNSESSSVNGEKLHLNFFPGSFTYSNGDSVTGDVQIEIKELFTKMDFLYICKKANYHGQERNFTIGWRI